MTSFVKYCLSYSTTTIQPLHCRFSYPTKTLCNPSICKFGDDIITNIRGVNYMLWYNESGTMDSIYGPLYYITENGDDKLRSENYIGKINEEHTKIQWSSPDRWNFVGLEDIRLVPWEDKLYATGVRRDYWMNGEGRMVLAEVDLEGNYTNEVVLEKEGLDFCEKNWMPIEDMPFHYLRWVNPLHIIKVDPQTGVCEDVLYNEMPEHCYKDYDGCQMRGSSQVIKVKDYHIAIIHLCHLEKNQKDEKCNCEYPHQFIVWDKDWNMIYLSKPFHFADYCIEFTNGMMYKDGLFYITFALNDNSAWLLTVDESTLEKYLHGNEFLEVSNDDLFTRYFSNTKDSNVCVEMGDYWKDKGQSSAAACCYKRACEYFTFNVEGYYKTLLKLGRTLASIQDCVKQERHVYLRMIDIRPTWSDGYHMLGQYYFWRNDNQMAYTMFKLAHDCNHWMVLDSVDNDVFLLKAMYYTEDYEAVEPLMCKLRFECNESQKQDIDTFLNRIKEDKKNIYRML